MFTEIGNAIAQAATIVILRHQNPDPDAIGSQTGLATLIREAYPDKTVYTPGVTQAGLTWIGEMTPVNDDVYQDALVIVVDTANTPRLDGSPAYQQAKQLIKIDHHPDVEHFGDIVWVDDQSASCAELIYKLTLHIPALKLSKRSAAALYAGIVGDTNRFLYDSTTADTLATATALARTGINVSKISHHDYEITPQTARLEAFILTNFKLTDTGLGYVILNRPTLKQFNLKKGDLDNVVPLIDQWPFNHVPGAVFETINDGFNSRQGLRWVTFINGFINFVDVTDVLAVRFVGEPSKTVVAVNQVNFKWDGTENLLGFLEREASSREVDVGIVHKWLFQSHKVILLGLFG